MSKQHRRFSLVPLTFSSWIKRTGKMTFSPAVPPQAPVPCPAAADRNAWHAYWQAHGQSWRTEPEIDPKRQAELDQHRAIVPDTEKGIYPFKGMKLSRPDVEWLLATHENGRGPVDWSDESQRNRDGLDLRGSDLCHVDLRQLPLARLRCGFTHDEQRQGTEAQCVMARAHMEDMFLNGAQLQGVYLHNVLLARSQLVGAQLEGADLSSANLQEANLMRGQFKQAILRGARLQEANLYRAQLEEANLYETKLSGANLRDVMLSSQKHIGPLLADVQWTEVNLARVNWSQGMILGDEQRARQKKTNGKKKTNEQRLPEYESAVRANRQLAVALQDQGLNEEAACFAYQAQKLQRIVLRRRHRFGQYLFSLFLDLLAGYGYKPWRSFLAYLLVISGFATAYYFLGHIVGPTLSPLGAFVFSMTSFHGRGFFPGNNISLDDPLTVLAAFEALVGLIIEVMFIATLTQRFFNR